ncbi:hypothetical protein SAMN02910356_00769 [Selenomonas sp. GACV-9]|uniref:hypothetical protein n=1 Tax=Selenomonas sp. GACV-9 TaxID=3158782 RepID=UPI0008E12AD6|nr:hypothetical protein SAMN02910356_00769 [Selenomonas ruminantium]
MKKHKILLASLLLLVMCISLTGCFGDKPLQQVSVQGEVYKLSLEMPFSVGGVMKDVPVNQQLAVAIKKRQSCMERPTGEDIHMAEFTASTFDRQGIEKNYGSLKEPKAKQFYADMGKAMRATYIQSLAKAAKMTNVTTDEKQMTIDGRDAVVTTVNCKMRGEDEVLKVVYIDDAEESWLVTLAYPKEKSDGIGKQIDETIIPGIKLTK